MRVLIVNSLLTGGGVDSHSLSLCRALLQQGVEVTLTLPAWTRWPRVGTTIPGLRVLPLSAPRFLWPFLLAGTVRRQRIEVLHAHHGRDYWITIMAKLLARTGARVVVTRHLITPIKERTRRALARFADVVAVSDAVERSLKLNDRAHTLRIRRIHCGIDTQAFAHDAARRASVRRELGYGPQATVFAVIGNVDGAGAKGQFYFVAAAKQVLARHPTARFLCVGGGAPARLQAEADRLELGSNFRLLPFRDDVARLMQAIDVLVHPAVASEALGLVILEALCCAKPVIGSRLDGIPETFIDGRNGVLVPPRDVQALAAAMHDFAADPDRAACMGAAGRAWVERRFSLATLGAQTLAYYIHGRQAARAGATSTSSSASARPRPNW